jgi:hypothetical protein
MEKPEKNLKKALDTPLGDENPAGGDGDRPSEPGLAELAAALGAGRPKKLVFAGVHLAVADAKHVIVLSGPPALLEMLEDESDRLANLGWWGAHGLPKEPGVWRCDLELRPVTYETLDGTTHDENWSAINTERVWTPVDFLPPSP